MANEFEFPGEMNVDVRLTEPSAKVRVIRLRVHSPADGGLPGKPGISQRARDAVRVFVEAIDAGLFNGESYERAEILQTTAREANGERTETWELKAPPMDAEAFTVLARMLWVANAREVSIRENASAERLTVCVLPPPQTVRVTPWEVVKEIADDAKDAVVKVCFASDAPSDVVGETHRTLQAWGALVQHGGFAGADFPVSAAVMSECGTELENEVFLSFETIAVAAHGWGALWNGLRRIHPRAPIARLEIV